MKLLNSDRNDNFFAINKVRYNGVINSGESMMNTTMAVCITDNMIDGLNHYADCGHEPVRAKQLAKDFPLERKKALYAEMQKRVYAGEKPGARQQEDPQQEAEGKLTARIKILSVSAGVRSL